jgi:hypothetical protein
MFMFGINSGASMRQIILGLILGGFGPKEPIIVEKPREPGPPCPRFGRRITAAASVLEARRRQNISL